jgi:Fibronectin type III domain
MKVGIAKKTSLVLTLGLGLLSVVLSSDIDGPAHHGHGNITGATTGTIGHCQTSSCHGSNNPLNIVQLQVLDTATMLPISTYDALQTYLVKMTGDATGISTSLPGFGFQASAVLGNRTQAGVFTIPDSLVGLIHTYVCGATTVVEHSQVLSPIDSGVNKYEISFYWTAPPPASDSVSFHSLLNAVNGNGASSGDNPDAAPVVTIYENAATATCGVPTGLTDSQVTGTTAYLYWMPVAGAISYVLQYREVGTTTWSSVTASTNNKTVTGLSPLTSYEFSIQTTCSGSSSVSAAGRDTLTTGEPSAVQQTTRPTNLVAVVPNPASEPAVTYTLTASQTVSLTIYDLAGRVVAQPLDNEYQSPGVYICRPQIRDQGIYLVVFRSAQETETVRFVKR